MKRLTHLDDDFAIEPILATEIADSGRHIATAINKQSITITVAWTLINFSAFNIVWIAWWFLFFFWYVRFRTAAATTSCTCKLCLCLPFKRVPSNTFFGSWSLTIDEAFHFAADKESRISEFHATKFAIKSFLFVLW